MPRSSDRGGVEPFAALAAVLAISAGITIYAHSVGQALPKQADDDRRTPRIALERAYDRVQQTGIVHPSRLPSATDALPVHLRANVTLRTEGHSWSVGPTPPGSVRAARRSVGVRTGSGQIKPGTLTVKLWE
jgi:hypothetical protein